MSRTFFSMFLIYQSFMLIGQSHWNGEYKGTLEGDQVTLFLESAGSNMLKGWMKDSNQRFDITAEFNGSRMAGTATENTFGLVFSLLGELKNDQLEASLIFELLGEKTVTPFTLFRVISGSSNKNKQLNATSDSKISLPKGAYLDPAVCGTWTKHESYNSGYGDNFMGANFSQSLSFLPDGRVGEAGSNASMSGSHYSGNSSGSGKGIIDGLLWYTVGNQLYLQVSEQGKTQQIHLGKYYVERNNMLITGVNGEKLLLAR